MGDAGNDTLNGVYGNDTIDGGAGDDVFRYTGMAPGDADLSAGSADVATNVEHMDITDQLAALLSIGGAALADSQSIGNSSFGASTNIAFDATSHVLMIDVDGDQTFSAAADFSVTLAGVTSVSYHAADSSFLLT
jgi:hypothetical protein